MLIEAAMLWTIFSSNIGETVLQYGSENECRAAIEGGLPYTSVSPKDQLRCVLRPDHNPRETCSDGSIADLRPGQTDHIAKHGHCRDCTKTDGNHVTSVLCEAHGYRPSTDADSDGCSDSDPSSAICKKWWPDATKNPN